MSIYSRCVPLITLKINIYFLNALNFVLVKKGGESNYIQVIPGGRS